MKRYKLSTLLAFTLLVVYLAGAAVLVVLVNVNAKRQALTNAEHFSRLILDRNVVTHSFFNNVLKTSLFDLLNQQPSEPSWLSSTFAIKSVASDYEFFGEDGLYYKEASLNARNPANEADPYEREFIARLNSDPRLTVSSEIRDYGSQPFLVVLRRGQTVRNECLLCHGNPADAPASIVSHYGRDRGFHRTVGTAISALSIRIPLTLAYQEADAFSVKLSALLLGVLLAIFLIHYSVSDRLLFRPIGQLHRKAELIAGDPDHLGDTLPIPTGRELAKLVAAFNQMSTSLRGHQATLEATIRQRTAQLETVNQALRDDIEQRKQVERKLEHLSQRNELILNTAREGIMGLDREGRIVFLNRAAETLLGRREEDLAGKPLVDLLDSDDGEPADARSAIGEVLDKGATINQREASFLHRTGRAFPVEFSCAPIVESGIVGAVLSFNDITERKLTEQEIQKLAFYDQLTGLPNRTLFYDRLTQRVAQAGRDSERLALMFLDLDDFKTVNDTFGHAAGDEYLQTIARRLLESSRQADTVARLGGDEFVWFGEISGERDATTIARKFLDSVAQPVHLGTGQFSSTVSIGIAVFPDTATDVVGLLKGADAAMYAVKQKSKNAFHTYHRGTSS